MTEIDSLISSDIFWLFVAVVAVLALGAAAAYWFLLREKAPLSTSPRKKARDRLDYQPAAKPVRSFVPLPLPAREKEPLQEVLQAESREQSVLDGKTDIQQSVKAVADKYKVQSFTLATADGLVLASTAGERAHQDAAQFCDLYTRAPAEIPRNVSLFTISHKDSPLVGIIVWKVRKNTETEEKIQAETKDILNWWI